MLWETQNSATVQNLRLKLQGMRRDDIVEALEKYSQEPAEVRSESYFDQLFPQAEEQIYQLHYPFLEHGNEKKLVVFVFGEIFVIRGSLVGVKIEWTLGAENSTECRVSGNSKVSNAGETTIKNRWL